MISSIKTDKNNKQHGHHPDMGVRLTIDELLALRRDAMPAWAIIF